DSVDVDASGNLLMPLTMNGASQVTWSDDETQVFLLDYATGVAGAALVAIDTPTGPRRGAGPVHEPPPFRTDQILLHLPPRPPPRRRASPPSATGGPPGPCSPGTPAPAAIGSPRASWSSAPSCGSTSHAARSRLSRAHPPVVTTRCGARCIEPLWTGPGRNC